MNLNKIVRASDGTETVRLQKLKAAYHGAATLSARRRICEQKNESCEYLAGRMHEGLPGKDVSPTGHTEECGGSTGEIPLG